MHNRQMQEMCWIGGIFIGRKKTKESCLPKQLLQTAFLKLLKTKPLHRNVGNKVYRGGLKTSPIPEKYQECKKKQSR